MIPPFIASFFGGLPWGKILLALAVAGVLFAVGLYIRSAEQAKAENDTLRTQNAELALVNQELEKAHKTEVAALQSSMKRAKEREIKYASAIEEIQAQPDSACVRNSPALRTTIRLLRSRHGD